MADLMADSNSYEDLKDKYDDFRVPLIRIKANGTELVSTMKLSIMDFKITLSLEAASMVVFRLGDLYDVESHSFDDTVKNKFTLGSIMEVEIGYLSSTEMVFKGFVAMLRAEYGKVPALVVTLMDARRLMMLSGTKQLMYDVQNYSELVNTILDDYSGLCSSSVDDTSDNLEKPISQQRNDYLFITKDIIQAGKADREFFVLADKAYFRTPRSVKTPITTLTLGKELYTLQVEESYLDLQIEVSGYDPTGQTILTGTADVTGVDSQKKILSSTPVYSISDPDADTQDKVDQRAEAIAAAKGWQLCRARGVMVGLPEIVPGRYVEVKKLEEDLGDHKYYITEVVHEINNEKFQTTFEVGGWL